MSNLLLQFHDKKVVISSSMSIEPLFAAEVDALKRDDITEATVAFLSSLLASKFPLAESVLKEFSSTSLHLLSTSSVHKALARSFASAILKSNRLPSASAFPFLFSVIIASHGIFLLSSSSLLLSISSLPLSSSECCF